MPPNKQPPVKPLRPLLKKARFANYPKPVAKVLAQPQQMYSDYHERHHLKVAVTQFYAKVP